MALVSQSDVTHSLLSQTVPGVTPTTGTRYGLPLTSDQGFLNATQNSVASPTKMPNRASNGSRRTMKMVEGSMDMRAQRSPVVDVLLQSALSNVFATNVLKAGQTDSYFTIFTRLQSGLIKQYQDCIVSGFKIEGKAGEGVMFSWDIMGNDWFELSAEANALVPTTTTYTEFVSADVQTISLVGTPLSVAEFSFETKLDRTRRQVVSSNTGLAFGVNGFRETVMNIKAYRDSWAIGTAITGNAQAVGLNLGATGLGYNISLPAAYGDVPTDELNNGSAFVNVSFKAGYDSANDTDLIFTRN